MHTIFLLLLAELAKGGKFEIDVLVFRRHFLTHSVKKLYRTFLEVELVPSSHSHTSSENSQQDNKQGLLALDQSLYKLETADSRICDVHCGKGILRVFRSELAVLYSRFPLSHSYVPHSVSVYRFSVLFRCSTRRPPERVIIAC
jgi:hypothetical protein